MYIPTYSPLISVNAFCLFPFSFGNGSYMVVSLVALLTFADGVDLLGKLLRRERLLPGAYFGLLHVPIFQAKAVCSVLIFVSPVMGACDQVPCALYEDP